MRALTRVVTVAGAGIVFLAAGAGALWAQADQPAGPPGGPMRFERMGPGPFGPDDALGFVRFEEGLGGKTVSGAPFSATISTQSTEVLSDGNQIQRSTTGTFARDSEGRTRSEMSLPAIGPWASSGKTPPHFATITDPVAGKQYMLDSNRKVARQTALHTGGRHGQNATANDTARPNWAKNKDVTVTSLGTQSIGGVQANGTLYTRTIPAGTIGNAKPIVMTVERWYSPDLSTVVMTKRTDPRMGVRVFQLTDIQRQEPDASLFQVPADYTLRQAAAHAGVRGNWHGQAPAAAAAGQASPN